MIRLNAGASRWIWLSLLIVATDHLSKLVIVQNLEVFDSIEILAVFNIVRLHNEGAAFSFLSEASGWQRWAFTGLGLIVSIAIVVWLRRLPARGQSMLAAGLAAVMGGALGNVIDRILRGHVVDFIQVHYEDWYFPAFNVADSAITIGAGLLILDNILQISREDSSIAC